MKRNTIESSLAFLPYQAWLLRVSVMPAPRSYLVSRNGPSPIGALPFFGLQMQSFHTVSMSVPARACCGRTYPKRPRQAAKFRLYVTLTTYLLPVTLLMSCQPKGSMWSLYFGLIAVCHVNFQSFPVTGTPSLHLAFFRR